MKKSTLALSVAAAIGSFGLVGNAFAIGSLGVGSVYLSPTTSALTGATAGTVMNVNPDGIGHQLIVPYYSVQANNTTLLNIANTDTVNAKVVKVRFRAAANSDDVFDFQLLLSPGDIWAGSLTQDAATGVAKLKAFDNSCTIPGTVRTNSTLPTTDASGTLFLTNRVDPTPASGSAANETREGYVEIINMADIPPNAWLATSSAATKLLTLFGTVKHANKSAACNTDVLGAALLTDYATVKEANEATFTGFSSSQFAYSITAPSGGLTADWVILNQTNTAAWSGSATAIRAENGSGVSALGNLVFWPQLDAKNYAIANAPRTAPRLADDAATLALRLATADPLFVTQIIPIQSNDLPDLSTPYVSLDVATPTVSIPPLTVGTIKPPASVRIDDLANKLAVSSITNQFVTREISGVTDHLFSQPTRRYSVGVNYKSTLGNFGGSAYATTGTTAVAVLRNDQLFTDTTGVTATNTAGVYTNLIGTGSSYYTRVPNSITGIATGNLGITGRQVCLNSVQVAAFFDREESTASAVPTVSPTTSGVFELCGEAAVLSVNSGGVVAGSALNASVVRNDVTFPTGFDVGSATFSTTYTGSLLRSKGLPILSGTFMRVANGAVNYGFSIPSKVTR